MHSEDLPRVEAEMRKCMAERAPLETEYRVIGREGNVHWLATRGLFQYDDQGLPDRLLGILMDITGRKRAEEAVAAAQRQIQNIIDNTPALVYAVDLEERFVLVNAALAELLKSTPEQMKGRRRHEFMPKMDADWHEANDLKAIEAGKALELEEYSLLEDRSITWLTTKFPLRDAQGRIYAVAGISSDISSRKRTEEALQSALAEKEVLLRELAHRTKNNMQVICSLMSLQAATFADKHMLGVLSDTQDRIRAMALVHEKLHRSGNFASLNIKDYAEDLLKTILGAHHVTGGRIRTEITLDDVSVSIDFALPLGLIINELVSNSLKHAFPGPKSGAIFLSLTRRGEQMEMRYRDDGPGLPRDFDLSRIRSLGLKLVQNLATLQLRGTIDIRLGSQTEFVFTFGEMTQAVGG
ncbi:MAG: PAS domain-containing protein [Deltaproteobacteria bacterium]|nr:PAS domain-containing protein [Deltaproteobacteria bacterium]